MTDVKQAIDPVLKKMAVDEVIEGKMTIAQASKELNVRKDTIVYYLNKRGYTGDGSSHARKMTVDELQAFYERDRNRPHTFRGAERPGPISPRADEVLEKAVAMTRTNVLQPDQAMIPALVVNDRNVAEVLQRVQGELQEDRALLAQATQALQERNDLIENLQDKIMWYQPLEAKVNELERVVEQQANEVAELTKNLATERQDAEFGRSERQRQGLVQVNEASKITAEGRELLREQLGRQLARGNRPEGYGEHR